MADWSSTLDSGVKSVVRGHAVEVRIRVKITVGICDYFHKNLFIIRSRVKDQG